MYWLEEFLQFLLLACIVCVLGARMVFLKAWWKTLIFVEMPICIAAAIGAIVYIVLYQSNDLSVVPTCLAAYLIATEILLLKRSKIGQFFLQLFFAVAAVICLGMFVSSVSSNETVAMWIGLMTYYVCMFIASLGYFTIHGSVQKKR